MHEQYMHEQYMDDTTSMIIEAKHCSIDQALSTFWLMGDTFGLYIKD